MLSLNLLEGYLQRHASSRLNQLIIQNPEALYEGRFSVKEEVQRNVGRYLSSSLLGRLGVRTRIIVTTGDGRILYPTPFKEDMGKMSQGTDFSQPPHSSLNYVEMAAENYRILNQGLILSVSVKINHNSWLSNSILIFFVIVFVLIIQRFIRKGIKEAEKQEKRNKEITSRLTDQLSQAESELEQAGTKEQEYLNKIALLNKDKRELSTDINGLLDEMEKLEAGLEDQRNIREEKELEVLKLAEELDLQKEALLKPKKKKKKNEALAKRFRVLYKNVVFTDRAIDGFLSLNDEYKLKAEEIIHKLNEDDSQVPVKRKVFLKGGKRDILEVIFAYSGRIYFHKNGQSRTKILTIGTKNTQQKDMAFIESAK
jgi:hypothetical protein